MGDRQVEGVSSLEIPPPYFWEQKTVIPAPTYEVFRSRFGDAYPKPQFLESELGTTAVYDNPPPSGKSDRLVLIVHGLNTPALGMLSFVRELQSLDRNTHVVLFDLWGHGFSSTPLVPHTQQIFHSQIQQVLSFMGWGKAHIIGYSFGGVTSIRFSILNPWLVESVALLAPAGVLQFDEFDKRMQNLLKDSSGRYDEAIEGVLDFLEGGPLVVPDDWEEQVKSGKVVAQALRKWELDEHQGFCHSALSMFRDGGVYGSEKHFRKFAGSGLKRIVVLGELDDVCSKPQLLDLGLTNVEVLDDAGHDFVRSRSEECARIVHRFWTQ